MCCQAFTTNGAGQLLVALDGKCLTGTGGDGGKVSVVEAVTCVDGDGSQRWAFNKDGTAENAAGCLAVGVGPGSTFRDGSPLTMAPCNSTDPRQQFVRVNHALGGAGMDGGADGRGKPVRPPALSEAVLLDTIVSFRGDSGAPGRMVQHIELSGFRITHAATTQLRQYEVPSGGDW